jgi:hypothetical protein
MLHVYLRMLMLYGMLCSKSISPKHRRGAEIARDRGELLGPCGSRPAELQVCRHVPCMHSGAGMQLARAKEFEFVIKPILVNP